VVPKLPIVAKIEIAPGSVDKVLPLLTALRDRCLKDEPETLASEVLKPREGDTTLLIYEVYQDDAAFDAHWKGASVARVREEAGEMIVKITGTRCALLE
jgi:quinol monooxygenase YgiN